MTQFMEYISSGDRQYPDTKDLEAMLDKYPWFMTARVMLAGETGKKDTLLELHYLARPKKIYVFSLETDEVRSQESIPAELTKADEIQPHAVIPAERTETDIIDSFLQKDDLRIVPNDQTPEYDAARESSIFEPSDEIVSEELAEIYRTQGLNDQARQIYEQLSLLYPEKSIYFAKIISEIDSTDTRNQ